MRIPLRTFGLGWIVTVAVSALGFFAWFSVAVFQQDATVLPWILLPAAAIVLVVATTLAVPGLLMLSSGKPKPVGETTPQFGGQTLGTLMAQNALAPDAAPARGDRAGAADAGRT